MTKFLHKNLFLIIIICLTLGLAPFFPEPHIVGKINWIIGGGHGMTFMDYFDLILHGTPWILLISAIYVKIRTKK
jgi:hypothetical protein